MLFDMVYDIGKSEAFVFTLFKAIGNLLFKMISLQILDFIHN